MEGAKQREQRIREIAREKFFRFGFSRVTMDEIATEARVSKKTLYQHFAGKEELLRAVIETVKKEVASEVAGLLGARSLDFMERLVRAMEFLSKLISSFSPEFARDIQLYQPEIWREVENFRRHKVLENFGNAIKEGVKKGMVRADLNPELVTMIYITLLENLINPEALSRLPYSGHEMFDAIIKIMFEGVLTEKARSRLAAKNFLAKKATGGVL